MPAGTSLTVVERHRDVDAAFTERTALRGVFAGDDRPVLSDMAPLRLAGRDSRTIDADVDRVCAAVARVGMLPGIGARIVVNPRVVDLPAARPAWVQLIRRSFVARATPTPSRPRD